MNEDLLNVTDLSVRFHQSQREIDAVENVSFSIKQGETLALVGESGSGKSVTALSIMQLLPYPIASHPGGSIRFNGEELMGATRSTMARIRGNKIGMIFQEPLSSLNPLHRVRKQIGEVLKLHRGLNDQQVTERSLELLDLVGIRDPRKRLDSWPHQLSGGQRQRVMIAMALANEPDLLIADEPTTALDVTIQAQILKLLGDLQKQFNMAMLLITHDLGVVNKVSDRVCVMRYGKIVESGPTVQLFEQPKHAYTRELINAEPKAKKLEPKLTDTDTSGKQLLAVDQLRVWFPIKKGVMRRTVDHIKAVDDVSFVLNKGKTLGVVGESGCGKTTIALAIVKLVKSTGGIVFSNIDMQKAGKRDLKAARQRMQMVFQDPFASLSPRMSVNQIVAEGLRAHGMASNEAELQDRVAESLIQMELSPDIGTRFPHEFSGGQRQRIAIARAVIVRPELIMLDEPTSAVDRSVQAHILDLLLRVQETYGISYIFISHDLKVVRALADDVLVMRNGRVIEQGHATAIFDNPQQQYTQALMSAAFDLSVMDIGEPAKVSAA